MLDNCHIMLPERNPADARRFRDALGVFATGVTIVTTRQLGAAFELLELN